MRAFILLLSGLICLVTSGGVGAYSRDAGHARRLAVVATAVGELGVREHGFNAGPDVEKYQHSTGNHRGEPWCSSFVAWCLRRGGVITGRFGAARSWFDRRHVIWRRGEGDTPQPGDLVGYRWGADHICHVGLIENWPAGISCTTIEGNTHGHGMLSREGDGVYRNWRDKRQVAYVADVISDPRYTHFEN